ncbi:hypothetical protein [Halobacillus massiliensis]|nr:hypothetical protein [Halobacillus massiliensis]
MSWLHGIYTTRYLFVVFFSITSLSLLTYQSIAIFNAFAEFFEFLRRS